MLHGIIALFVILSVWGLVAVIQNTFGVRNQVLNPNDIPTVPLQ